MVAVAVEKKNPRKNPHKNPRMRNSGLCRKKLAPIFFGSIGHTWPPIFGEKVGDKIGANIGDKIGGKIGARLAATICVTK